MVVEGTAVVPFETTIGACVVVVEAGSGRDASGSELLDVDFFLLENFIVLFVKFRAAEST